MKTIRKNITDRTLKSKELKPQAEPFDVMDKSLPGFGVRILPGGSQSFIYFKRYPGSKNPTRRTLGRYPTMSLEQARQEARRWHGLIEKGIDPAKEEARLVAAALAAERAKETNTVCAALEVYAKRKLVKIRSGRAVEGRLRHVMAAWLDTPLADVDRPMIVQALLAITDAGHDAQAHQSYALMRAFFSWMVEYGKDFGINIETSPCTIKRLSELGIDEPKPRERVLSDDEIAAYWRVADAMAYPDGPFLKLLMMAACRRDEIADLHWREIDMKAGLIEIPAARMKGKLAHVVPITVEIRELLGTLPRFPHGDYVFSNLGGLQPIASFGRIQARLHKTMRAQGWEGEHFTLRDVRRSARTQIEGFPSVRYVVAEALLAHAKRGVNRVYNRFDYLEEKAKALDLWHARLRDITSPTPSNVLPLHGKADEVKKCRLG